VRLEQVEQQLQAQQNRQENENARLVRDLLNVGQAQQPAAARHAAVFVPPALPQHHFVQQPQGMAYNPFIVYLVFAWPRPHYPAMAAFPGPQPQQMPQQPPQPVMAPPAAPINNAQQQQLPPFQRGPVPNGFAVPFMNDHPPMPDYLQIARDNVPAHPAVPVFDLREDIPLLAQDPPHLANVARNMHQLEFMRQQNDARQADARAAARFMELAGARGMRGGR